MDLNKLTDDQLKIALKVVEEAERNGLNPDFVLPMVMIESGFNPKAVSTIKGRPGAIGVMQLMPGTAKDLGVDPNDVDQNIAGGIRYLKQLIDNPKIGSDPYKVLAGYNAGPNSKFFQTGELNDLPTETLNHMLKVSGVYGGELVSPTAAQKEAQAAESEGDNSDESGGKEEVKSKFGSDVPGAAEENKPFLGIIGATLGAGTAGSIETGKRLLPLVPNILNRIGGTEVNPNRPVSRASLQRYLNSQIAENLRLPVSELEKVSGAGKIRTMSEVQNALRAIQAVEEQKITKPMVRMVPGRPSVFEQTGRFTSSTIPGSPGVDLSQYEVKAGPIRQAVGRQLQTAGEVAGSVLPSAARVGLGALGGAGAVMSGYDAWDMANRLKNDPKAGLSDYGRLAAKTSSALGGALSMLPFGVTQGAGLLMQAPELAYQGYDALSSLNERRKTATKEDVERMLSNVDPMGNPIGGLP